MAELKPQANQQNLQQPNSKDLSPPKSADTGKLAGQAQEKEKEAPKKEEQPPVQQVLGQASQVNANAALTKEERQLAASMGLDSAGFRLAKAQGKV